MSADVASVASKWTNLRKRWQSRKYAPNEGQIREFFDETNGLSMELVNLFGTRDPDFYIALSECAGNAAAVIKQREAGVAV